MAIILSSTGLIENCTLHPPAKLPSERIIKKDIFRMVWKAVSLKVIAGATVMLSPVWIPIGSIFSTVQIMTILSSLSRKSSSSNSFHPKTACSTKTSCVGEASSPRFRASFNSSGVCTKLPPYPPKVKEGRITSGKPISWAVSFPSRKEFAIFEVATGIPISIISCRNFSRFSASSIASSSTPIIRTL